MTSTAADRRFDEIMGSTIKSLAPEDTRRPEYLGCNEGYVFYRDGRISPQTVQLYDESGKLLAIIPGVRTLYFAPLPR